MLRYSYTVYLVLRLFSINNEYVWQNEHKFPRLLNLDTGYSWVIFTLTTGEKASYVFSVSQSVSTWWRKENLNSCLKSTSRRPSHNHSLWCSFLFYYCTVGVGSLVTATANGPYLLRVMNERIWRNKWHGKTKYCDRTQDTRKQPVLVPLSPQHVSHRLPGNRTRASTVRVGNWPPEHISPSAIVMEMPLVQDTDLWQFNSYILCALNTTTKY
jgi:hypothetical protein